MPKIGEKPSGLASRILTHQAKNRRTSPLWKGPTADGITQSMLSRSLVCKERFRIMTCEGIKPLPSFSHRLEFGHMWHCLEEGYLSGLDKARREAKLVEYSRTLCQTYPTQQAEISRWYNIVKLQFEEYLKYWEKNDDEVTRKPLLQEYSFDLNYELPTGRIVRMRGKLDSVDLLGTGKNSALFVQENKTKGDIYEPKMRQQLLFDLQTMLYLVALEQLKRSGERLLDTQKPNAVTALQSYPIGGVMYNVIRRPLSGGKGMIRQLKPTKKNPRGESTEHYIQRVVQFIRDDPAHYFMRWRVDIHQDDIEKFKAHFLHPYLENLCDDYEWWSHSMKHQLSPYDYLTREKIFPHHNQRHFICPYGFYNVLAEGGSTDLDEYLNSGSDVGLHRVTNLFTELA